MVIDFYECEYDNKYFGRYGSVKPCIAARKAFAVIIRHNNDLVDKEIEFKIFTVKKNKIDIMFYTGIRKKMETPKIINKGIKTIEYNYENKIIKISKKSYFIEKEIDKIKFNDIDKVNGSFSIDIFILDNSYSLCE